MTTSTERTAEYGLSTGRLEALSDGVLAIVITLLILTFVDASDEVADSPMMASSELMAFVVGLWPHLFGYVLSFVLIAIYWILHHHMFHYIRHADRTMLWLNLMFLMSVAFLPFPTDLLATCMLHESNVVVVLYGVTHLVCGLTLSAVWCYATWGRRLVDKDLAADVVRATLQTALTGPALYALAIAVSFLSINAAMALYCLVPLLYLAPSKIDRMWLAFDRAVGASPTSTHLEDGQLAALGSVSKFPTSNPEK